MASRCRTAQVTDADGLVQWNIHDCVKCHYKGKSTQGKFSGWVIQANHPLYDVLHFDDNKSNQPDISRDVHSSMIEKNPSVFETPAELLSGQLLKRVIIRTEEEVKSNHRHCKFTRSVLSGVFGR